MITQKHHILKITDILKIINLYSRHIEMEILGVAIRNQKI